MKKIALMLALSLPVVFTACNLDLNLEDLVGDLLGDVTVTAPGTTGTLDNEELFGTIISSTVKPQPEGKYFAEGDLAMTLTCTDKIQFTLPTDATGNDMILNFEGVPSFMNNSSSSYQLGDVCLVLDVKNGIDADVIVSFKILNTDTGTDVDAEFTLPAGTEKADLAFSAKGPFYDEEYVLGSLASVLSPLPASVKVHDFKFADHNSKSLTKAAAGNIELSSMMIVPLSFTKGSKFVVSSTLGNMGIKVDPANLKGLGLKKLTAPANIVNTTPFDITIVSAGSGASVSFPTIKAGSIASPTTTTGQITVDNSNGDLYENIGNIAVTVTATAAEEVSQINKNQNIVITCEEYSVTVSK